MEASDKILSSYRLHGKVQRHHRTPLKQTSRRSRDGRFPMRSSRGKAAAYAGHRKGHKRGSEKNATRKDSGRLRVSGRASTDL